MKHTSTQSAAMKEGWLYDAIMEVLEPELMSQSIETLDGTYRSESAEAHTERMARYDRAFATFDDVLTSLGADMIEKTRAQGRGKKAAVRKQEEKERGASLTKLEQDLDSSLS
ncbi:MAG: hypothetical protein PHH13_02380 [Candidatus Peribacteraceae bacterium]|nr:hypothetical protein [Candidatus Peribacteraceae bacterium]